MVSRSRLKRSGEKTRDDVIRMLRVNVFKTDKSYKNPDKLTDKEMNKVSKGLMRTLKMEDLSGTVEFEDKEKHIEE